MSDTTVTSTKAPAEPPDTATGTTAVAGPDGQSVPIEFTITQAPANDAATSPGRPPRGALRALPAAVFGAEALSTGTAALYTATGMVGTLTAAGVVAGTAALTAAGVAATRSRRTRRTGLAAGSRAAARGGMGRARGALGSTGAGGSRRSTTGTGLRAGTGAGGRIGSQRRTGGALGAASAGASTPRTGRTGSGVSLTKPSRRPGAMTRQGARNSGAVGGRSGLRPGSATRAAGAGPGARSGRGTGLGKSGSGSGRTSATGGRGGMLSRLGLCRRTAGTGPAGAATSPGGTPGASKPGSAGHSAAPGRMSKARSTIAAATRRAGRAAMRGAAAARRSAVQAVQSPTAQGVRERIRTARRELAKRGRAAVAYLLRSAGAKLAAGAVGALAATPGLLLKTLGATCGGVLRFLRLAPRSGKPWGSRFTQWGPRAAKAVHRRLMRKAKAKWDAAIRPDVLTNFDEPGHQATSPVPAAVGDTRFGGNLVSVFKQETEAVRDAYAKYEPPMMLAVAAEYWGLPEGLTSTAEAVRQLAVNTADKYPADARMADLVAQVYALLHQAAQKAQEVGPLFAKVHEHDLRRYEEPRPGEHMWNILERRQDGSYAQHQPSQFVAVTQDIAHVYARYEPGHMSQVAAEFDGIPEGIENVGAAVNLLQVRSNEKYPVDKQIVDAIADIHMLLMKAASAAQELMPAFRRLHAPDISRHEAPRNGPEAEGMWDV